MYKTMLQVAFFFGALFLISSPSLAGVIDMRNKSVRMTCDSTHQTKKNCMKKRKKHYSIARRGAKKACKKKKKKFKGGSLKRDKKSCWAALSSSHGKTKYLWCDFTFKCK